MRRMRRREERILFCEEMMMSVREGVWSLLAWEFTIAAPGGLKPAVGDEAGEVVGQGVCELAFGS